MFAGEGPTGTFVVGVGIAPDGVYVRIILAYSLWLSLSARSSAKYRRRWSGPQSGRSEESAGVHAISWRRWSRARRGVQLGAVGACLGEHLLVAGIEIFGPAEQPAGDLADLGGGRVTGGAAPTRRGRR